MAHFEITVIVPACDEEAALETTYDGVVGQVVDVPRSPALREAGPTGRETLEEQQVAIPSCGSSTTCTAGR